MSSTWPQTVVVTDESFESDDPYDIVYSNIQFVNALLEEYLKPEEIPVDAFRSYYVDYYLAQVEDGGFSQFVHNSRWDPMLIRHVEDGLRLMNATGHAELFQQSTELVAARGADRLATFLESEYFDENPERDFLNRYNDRFYQLSESKDLIARNAAWLQSLPNLVVLTPSQVAEEVQRRAVLVPDREQRIAEARANEPRYLKQIRALCNLADQELSHVTIGDPTHEHAGQRTLAWHFITDQGHHYLVEHGGKALMFGDDDTLVVEMAALPE